MADCRAPSWSARPVSGIGPWEAVAGWSRWEPEVRLAGRDDIEPLVLVLARAFADDPVACYLFDGERARARGLRRFFGAQLRTMMMGPGEVWTTSRASGAAIWVRPGAPRAATWRDAVRLAPVFADVVLGGRASASFRLLADVERARPTQEHWYLATLGTDPRAQGRGVGSALLRSTLKAVDDEGMPAYLESSKRQNVPFYMRHGFEVTGVVRSVDGAVSLWPMWRSPRPPGG